MEDLGHQVTTIQSKDLSPITRPKWFVRGVAHRLRLPLDQTNVNKKIREAVSKDRFDLIWIDKGNTVLPSTLGIIREKASDAIVAGYSPDDMSANHNNSRYFVNGLKLYDVYFTTKSYGVAELHAMGAPKVFFSGNAYDPATHRPMEIDENTRRNFGASVGFIGSYEIDRARSISHLFRNGIDVKIRGSMWDAAPPDLPLPKVSQHVLGDDYARGICATDINLCFLRKINRDLQTQRSVEIPACGAFMLAERTDEHRDLFEEGKEAEYFESDEELADKIRYYLANPDERLKIARAGRERCLRSGYSYQERIRTALQQLQQLRAS
jgi:spore maturation protein CgeB